MNYLKVYILPMKSLRFLTLLLVSANLSAQSLRISADGLHQLISEESAPIILDVRSNQAFVEGHIPKAQHFSLSLSYTNRKIDGRIAKPAVIQKAFRERGIDTNTSVVIYDNGDLVDAARIFWLLEAYNIKTVKVLDGGFSLWNAKNLPVSTHTSQPVTSSHYVASINHNRLANKFTTLLATLNNSLLIIDARTSQDYSGLNSSAIRAGHIPSAINIPAAENFNQSGTIKTIKPIEQLKSLYRTIPDHKKVIVYCSTGRLSSANYLAMRELGLDVANYDASWQEWGNDPSLPIER